MSALAAISGYVIGSIPTAAGIARMWGVDLRRGGSGNPGANNAMRLGGPLLGATVLLVELAKGLAAVRIGFWLGAELGAVLAAIGAVGGNVYNVWYRLEGGKGLAISGGVLLGAAPALLIPAVSMLVVVVAPTRSSGLASLAAVLALDLGAIVWWVSEWPSGGLVPSGPLLIFLSVGMTLILWPKHQKEAWLRKPIPR